MRIALIVLCPCAVSYVAADTPPTQTTVAPAIVTTAPGAATAVAVVPTSTTVSVAVPAVSAAVSSPVLPKTPSCDDIKVFKAKMHAAVDAALKYPASLKFQPASGVTIVTYDYQDGRTEDAHITQWSGDRRLDSAALKAVKEANFASIRPDIGHTHIRDAVIIVFDNSANIDKNAAEHEKKKDPVKDRCG